MIYPRTGEERTGYKPPKSVSFGHQARKRNPRVAWEMTQAFLDRHCYYTYQAKVELSCWDEGLYATTEASAAGFAAARERFGDPHERLPGVRRWKLDPRAFGDGLEVCGVNERWPNAPIGPLTLTSVVLLVWRAFAPREVEPRAFAADPALGGDVSLLGVSVFRRALFLQPSLVVPAAWDSTALAEFLAEIEPSCPFRFRDQYFYRLLPGAKGEYGQARKLEKGWRARLTG